jgi:hypothetical protein
MTFPQYRKYSNSKVFFKINSDSNWSEIQIVGNHYQYRNFNVSLHPDRMFVLDLIACRLGILKASADEFESLFKSNQLRYVS